MSVAAWIAALAVSLIAGLLDSSGILVTFPITMVAATAVTTLCYGLRSLC
jgi:hypothetical protein